MSDKDQFTFEDDDENPETNQDDKVDLQSSDNADEEFPGLGLGDPGEPQGLGLDYDDDFPETDLSAAFSEGEHAMDDPAQGEPVEYVKGGGSSRTKSLLLVLLLVVAGGAGAYYFMDLGGSTLSVPAVPVPAQKAKQSVALPAKPASKAVPPAKVEPAEKPVTVAVPPPPPAEPAAKVVETGQTAPAVKEQAPAAASADEKSEALKPEAKPASVSQKAVVAAPTPTKKTEPTKVATLPKEKVGGAFVLDAGSYLLESNRDNLVAKIEKLGYEPLVTQVDATLDMTRLRLGTFSKDEVQEALDFARTIEPGAYSAPAGDRYVVYAGTFLQKDNIDKLSQRFLKEGIKVHPEPVQVVRGLNRIRFGSFATKQEAADAAQKIAASGVKAEVVKFK